MEADDTSNILQEMAGRFDFGEYEARAYVAILEHGSLTATAVAERADIPQPRVYDTVRSLADNGLVELHESRPMRVVAVDPERSFSTIQSTLDDLVTALSDRYRTPAREGEVVSLVKSRQTILRYLEEVIERASYELVLSLTPDLLAEYESLLCTRRQTGVTIELLVSPENEIPDPDTYEYSRVATTTRTRRGVTTPIVGVADGRYSVYTPQDALANDGSMDRYGVIFNRSELGFLVSAFLNTVVWPSATVLVAADGPREFPRRYATIRRCVADIATEDGPFFATIYGRNVRDGTYTTLQGKIVDVSVGRNQETATLTIETPDGPVDVGGQLAALEDVEAYELAVGREGPPSLDTHGGSLD